MLTDESEAFKLENFVLTHISLKITSFCIACSCREYNTKQKNVHTASKIMVELSTTYLYQFAF